MDSIDQLDNDSIQHFHEVIAVHRRTISQLVLQASYYGGEVFLPLHSAAALYEARESIRRIKISLRSAGIAVSNEQNDESAPPAPLTVPQDRHRAIENKGVIGVIGDNYGTVIVHQPPEIPAPPVSLAPPQTTNFVGRVTELQAFAQQLALHHMLVITGIAGVGKTALAAQLASQVNNAQKTFWHSFHEGEAIEGIIWQLAGFLAQRNQNELWQLLNNTRQAGNQPPPLPLLLNYALEMLRNHDYLIVLDDLHYIYAPDIEQFVNRLREPVREGALTLIITSRSLPAFARSDIVAPLNGLARVDTDTFLAARGVAFSPNLMAKIYDATGGNPQFLTLAIDSLRHTEDPARMIEELTQADHIERYLLREIDSGLTDDQRDVLSAVATLLGYPATHSTIETLLPGTAVRRAILQLVDRYLLIAIKGETGTIYQEHAIVQSFYYDLLSRNKRQALHASAGSYYSAGRERNPLWAARHFERADKLNQAATSVVSYFWEILNQGQAHALQNILNSLAVVNLEAVLAVRVAIAKGQVCAFLGDFEQAEAAFQAALQQLTVLPPDPILMARAYRGMGDLTKQNAPHDALVWYQRGVDAIGDADANQRAALYIGMGIVQMRLHDLQVALDTFDRGLELLPMQSHQLQATALVNMAAIYFDLGHTDTAINYAEQAVAISRTLHDHFQVAYATINIGIFKFTSGRWREAISDWEQALLLAKSHGSAQVQAQLYGNLGLAYSYLGDAVAEERYLTQALEQALHIQDVSTTINVQIGLAQLRLRQHATDAAHGLLREAETATAAFEDPDLYATIWRTQAEVYLAQHQHAEALIYVERALALARDTLGGTSTLGITLRVVGQAYIASKQYDAALEFLRESMTLLDSQDSYEAARTRAHLGYALIQKEAQVGLAMLHQAYESFEALGAQREINEIKSFLAERGI